MNYLIRGEDYLARTPKFKLVGRSEELKRLAAILMRKSANSILLMGAGGVGCTALCKGLQALKGEPDAPFDIVTKRLFWLETDQLFASGKSEAINESFQKLMQVLYRTPDAILIIEDTRDFVEACRNIGAMHFINALCLAIKSDKVQAICEVRDDDLDYILKSHSDMRELFTMIDLAEPSGDALLQIVQHSAQWLTDFHQLAISEEALKTAIELTTKYRSEGGGISRAQPERSVTLLDRSLAAFRLEAHRHAPGLAEAEAGLARAKGDAERKKTEAEIAQIKEGWQRRQAELKVLFEKQRDGEVAILDHEQQLEDQLAKEATNRKETDEDSASVRGRIAKFAKLASGGGLESDEVMVHRKAIKALQGEIAANREAFDRLTREVNDTLKLDRDAVLAEFSRISGISVSKLNENEREKLRRLEGDLAKRIFGQPHVISALANAVKTARVGRRNQDRPQASFMFMGPSGVGKTEMAKVLALSLLDDEKALTRFDMSEYMEKHAVSRLIGAPPGYEGFEAGGILTNAMRRNPLRVLLFDEIEKAHPDVFNVFLQILSDGRLTDNVGRTVSFSESIIIMTTNIGQPHFLNPKLSFEEASAEALEEVQKTYRSEFLNRFAGRQNIICFNKLDLESIEKIVRREFDGINRTYSQDGFTITIAESDIKAFCKNNYDPAIGARGLPGIIQTSVEPMIVNRILEGSKAGATIIRYNAKKGGFMLEAV